MKSDRTVRAERRRIWWASLNQATRTIILIGVVVILVMLGIWIKSSFFTEKKPEITSEFINGKLDVVSELASAEMTYTGIVRYEDGSIPFLTKKAFTMVYTGTVKAGIDFSKIKVNVSGDSVVVTLPATEILSVYIDPNTISFYDESSALFNWSDKEDITQSLARAESDVRSNVDMEALKEKAEEQTERLIKGILEGAIGDKQLVIKQEKKTK